MTRAPFLDDQLRAATRLQIDAADPAQSIYVAANAGSGKTRVLVNRVSRLLLAGTLPEKIMCLTYTKAAASEMQERLFSQLGDWSVLGDAELQDNLAKLDGNNVQRSPAKLREARQLFAKALETPDGLKIHTIHAFCERILRRFPVEAGLAPGFEAIDDVQAKKVARDVKSTLYKEALEQPNSELARAISDLAQTYNEAAMSDLIGWVISGQYKIERWADIGLGPLAQRLGITLSEDGLFESAVQIKQRIWKQTPRAAVLSAAHELAQSKPANQKTAQKIYAALEQTDDQEAFDLYTQVFLTSKGALLSKVTTTKVALDLYGENATGYGSEVHRICAALEQIKNTDALSLTKAVFIFTRRAVQDYISRKNALRLVDFNDQIMRAKILLTQTEAKEWVLYKLDKGVEHILLDEAQDTSPEQWDIIEAIAQEFDAIENSGRTKFAVGDEKQSIYSFQGARPELFLERTQQAILSDSSVRAVPMKMSFRSAPQILNLVDAIFADCRAQAHIFDRPPAGDLPRHSAYRQDIGRVELWPLAPAPEKGEDERAWELPVDRLSAQSSRESLAGQIANTIRGWLDDGETVFDKDLNKTGGVRAIQPKDIMILVQKRTGFFNAIIRRLKAKGVPVAGADKLKLTDNIGVQDLISLGRFLCLPADDLSLAEVLKSPIFGWSDDDLLAIALRREGTLWQALHERSQPAFLEARTILARLLKMSEDFAPYELYARILSYQMPANINRPAQSILQRFYSRLGIEAADPIDGFLSRALAHQRAGPPSLERFLFEVNEEGGVMKREMEAGQNEVRVMTVHGSKGLEAPIIILPDTTQADGVKIRGIDMRAVPDIGEPQGAELADVADPSGRSDPSGFSGFVIGQKKDQAPPALGFMTELAERAKEQESLRLLYVALTRAQSRLIICGFESGSQKLAPGSWYDWVQRGFNFLKDEAANEHKQMMSEQEHVFGTQLVFGAPVLAAPNWAAPAEGAQLPDWAFEPCPLEGPNLRRVTPSHLLLGQKSASPPVRSPLYGLRQMRAAEGEEEEGEARAAVHNPFLRGNIIHKLLEILPELAEDKRAAAAQSYLSAQPHLSAQERAQIQDEVFGVLTHPDFVQIFAPGSRGEVSLAGSAPELPSGIYMNGQIDRLAVTQKQVWIVDYKSNRPPPSREEDVPDIYIAQMAAYRILAQNIYPKKRVRCALLWTDVPFLMELSAQKLGTFDLAAILTRQATVPN